MHYFSIPKADVPSREYLRHLKAPETRVIHGSEMATHRSRRDIARAWARILEEAWDRGKEYLPCPPVVVQCPKWVAQRRFKLARNVIGQFSAAGKRIIVCNPDKETYLRTIYHEMWHAVQSANGELSSYDSEIPWNERPQEYDADQTASRLVDRKAHSAFWNPKVRAQFREIAPGKYVRAGGE